ncbi:MAG: glycosyltransferase family 4 protein, partial [Thermoplasmata archaeon]|nr:glycosyltransferase family 4 protein [Thermoplasmata archaeon]
ADWVIAISSVTARSLEQNFAADPRRLSVIPLAPEHQPGGSDPGTSLRRERTYDFVLVGRMVREKRPEDLIASLAILKERTGWAGRAILLGSGPRLGPCRKLVRKMGLVSQVEVAGFVPPEDRDKILDSSRVLVVPSEREGFSLATLEGLSRGLPAVVAVPKYPEVFGVSEFVKDGEEGLYYPVADLQQLAERLSRLLADEPLQERLAAAGRARASQYRWEEIVQRLETELQRLPRKELAHASL